MVLTVDTRFFLTHFLAETDEIRKRTTARMREIQRESAIVPTIVLHEVYKFEYETLGRETAETRVDSILKANIRIVDLDPKIAIGSARLRCKYKELPTADSIIAATAMELRSRRVLSDDPHFRKIAEIQTEWI